jgi:hypothetical protein
MRDDLTHIYNDTNIKRISCNYLQYKNSDRLQGFGEIRNIRKTCKTCCHEKNL